MIVSGFIQLALALGSSNAPEVGILTMNDRALRLTATPNRCRTVPEPASMAVVGSDTSPYVAAVGISDGDMQVTDINTHWSQTVGVGNVGDGFGTPVFSGDRIFVPDYEHDAVAVNRHAADPRQPGRQVEQDLLHGYDFLVSLVRQPRLARPANAKG